MFENKLDHLNHQLKVQEDALQLAEDIKYLQDHPAFRRAILNGYCRDAVVENVAASIDMTLDPKLALTCINMAQAAGYLQQWMEARLHIGEAAKRNINEIKREISLDDNTQDDIDEEIN